MCSVWNAQLEEVVEEPLHGLSAAEIEAMIQQRA
jgi:hypothetical protein